MENEIYHLCVMRIQKGSYKSKKKKGDTGGNTPVGKRTRSDNTAALLPSQGSKAMGLGES